MTQLTKTLIAGVIAIGISNSALAECVAPSAPIVPDGNVASKDELLSAQSAYKAFESNFYDYRECLQAKEKALDPNAADLEAQKKALIDLDDVAFEELNRVAAEFNTAVKAYNAK